ncbi:uncharacterized protein LOC141629280 [Silene latifolia]|uniref:uncharacterized protein LOC141629280 n=1 Tax=Silene latifolia TaxID=37657 RepID=UPI003D779048
MVELGPSTTLSRNNVLQWALKQVVIEDEGGQAASVTGSVEVNVAGVTAEETDVDSNYTTADQTAIVQQTLLQTKDQEQCEGTAVKVSKKRKVPLDNEALATITTPTKNLQEVATFPGTPQLQLPPRNKEMVTAETP